MSHKPKAPKRIRSVKREMPDQIPDTPENIAKSILFTPPKKPQDWKFMQDLEGDTSDLEG